MKTQSIPHSLWEHFYRFHVLAVSGVPHVQRGDKTTTLVRSFSKLPQVRTKYTVNFSKPSSAAQKLLRF